MKLSRIILLLAGLGLLLPAFAAAPARAGIAVESENPGPSPPPVHLDRNRPPIRGLYCSVENAGPYIWLRFEPNGSFVHGRMNPPAAPGGAWHMWPRQRGSFHLDGPELSVRLNNGGRRLLRVVAWTPNGNILAVRHNQRVFDRRACFRPRPRVVYAPRPAPPEYVPPTPAPPPPVILNPAALIPFLLIPPARYYYPPARSYPARPYYYQPGRTRYNRGGVWRPSRSSTRWSRPASRSWGRGGYRSGGRRGFGRGGAGFRRR